MAIFKLAPSRPIGRISYLRATWAGMTSVKVGSKVNPSKSDLGQAKVFGQKESQRFFGDKPLFDQDGSDFGLPPLSFLLFQGLLQLLRSDLFFAE